MLNRHLTLFFLILFPFSVLSQRVSGIVKEEISGNPIPYVNIGIADKNFGTLTDSAGQYKLTFSKGQYMDSIVFQHVSYKPKSILVKDLIDNSDVSLEEKVTALNEIVISSKKLKTKKIGIRTHNPLLWGGLGISKDNIFEIAQEIKTNKTLRLLDFNIYVRIYQDLLDIKYRIKLYKSEEGVPGELILDENIVADGVVSGWNRVNLKPFNIVIKEDFFVSIEFLPDENIESNSLYAGAVLIGGNRYSRKTSLGKWNKAQGGYKLYVTGEY